MDNTHHHQGEHMEHIESEDKKIEHIASHHAHKETVVDQVTQYFQRVFQRKSVLVFALLAIVIGGLVIYKQVNKVKPQVRTITLNKQVLQKRSKDLGFIDRGLTGTAVDVNTGKVVKAARIFTANDKVVYLELDFNTAPKGTVIDYIRYKNGRYVDHGEVILTKANTKNVLFNWIINNLLSNARNGKWRIATYANGILAKRITYEVTGNKVSYVYPDEPIKATDPDYKLSEVVTASQLH